MWTPSHGHASVGWPTRTYLQQLWTRDIVLKTCWKRWKIEMNGERVREICACSMTWWCICIWQKQRSPPLWWGSCFMWMTVTLAHILKIKYNILWTILCMPLVWKSIWKDRCYARSRTWITVHGTRYIRWREKARYWALFLYILVARFLRDVVLITRSLCALKKLDPFRVLKNVFGPSMASNLKQRSWSIKHVFWHLSCMWAKCGHYTNTSWRLLNAFINNACDKYFVLDGNPRYRGIRES